MGGLSCYFDNYPTTSYIKHTIHFSWWKFHHRVRDRRGIWYLLSAPNVNILLLNIYAWFPLRNIQLDLHIFIIWLVCFWNLLYFLWNKLLRAGSQSLHSGLGGGGFKHYRLFVYSQFIPCSWQFWYKTVPQSELSASQPDVKTSNHKTFVLFNWTWRRLVVAKQ